jgi:hypothetical protein
MTGSSPYLVSFDDREDARAHVGMAGQPIVGSLHVCGECQWFEAGRREAATEGHCGLLARRMGGEVGDAIEAAQRACACWLSNLGGAFGAAR